ncbi:hypothetical protein [Brevundimonas sp. CEF1]|uniref:hypothetical protein n=1 Tax=Brevundimonas sp. CEF1 TaxID=3442642 RepID=UPI003F51160B
MAGIPQHILAAPVSLTVAEWNHVVQALGYLPAVVGGPIVGAIQAQTQKAPPAPQTDVKAEP